MPFAPGFFDELADAVTLLPRAHELAAEFAKLDMPAHTASKRRIRGPLIRTIRRSVPLDLLDAAWGGCEDRPAGQALRAHRRPLRHGRAPAQQVRVLLARLVLDHARKVHRHHGGDVGHAEAVGGHEVAARQAFVERVEELLPHRASPRSASAGICG
jgi:hypothetical protein